jgi:hypothetical protein
MRKYFNKIRSKYLGRKFGRWTVTRVTPVYTKGSTHMRYYLSRKTHDGATKTVAVSCTTMTALGRGETDMPTLLRGKMFQRKRFPSKEFRNSAWYTYNTNGSLE